MKYGEHSALNMFDEYSMISPKELLDYVGFTEDEIKDICQRKNVRFEGIKNGMMDAGLPMLFQMS